MKKKLIVLAAVAAVTAGFAAAEVAVGIRGGMGLTLGTSWAKTLDITENTELSVRSSMAVGAAVFVKIPVFNGLGIQPEFGISYNQLGLRPTKDWRDVLAVTDDEDLQFSAMYGALDIPVLVAYDFKIGKKITLTPLAGPKISIPMGKPKFGPSISKFGDIIEYDVASPVLFSIVTGADAAFWLRHGAIVTDLRYDIGISQLKGKTGGQTDDIAVPRSLFLSVGYQLAF